jgi:uncharacterized protein YaaN involved in tellurite resistance
VVPIKKKGEYAMSDFTLDLPNEEVLKAKIEKELEIKEETANIISEASKKKADQILDTDVFDFNDRQKVISAIETFGSEIITTSVDNNTILQKRLGELSNISGEGSVVASGLDKLSTEIEDLNPEKLNLTNSGFLNKFMNPMKKYFKKYQTADVTIGKIIDSLEEGSQTLQDDNTTLELESASMRNLSKQLMGKQKLGRELDDYLSYEIKKIKAGNGDPEKIKFIEEEVLFPLRQRLIDFDQMIAVNQQGLIAMETIKRNNRELIRSVDRAKTVTVSALRTAVIVAGTLYNQNLVLSKVKAINETTTNMLEATSKMLKNQGVEIQKQAIEANIDMNTLKSAFTDAIEAFESINDYKQKALPQMKNTINEFEKLISDSHQVVQKIENSNETKPELIDVFEKNLN